MKCKKLGLMLGLAVISGCASTPDTITVQDGFGEAYEIANEASKATEKNARDYVPRSGITHPGVSSGLYRTKPCDGQGMDPVSLIDTEASCNRERLDESQYSDTATFAILGGALSLMGGDATAAFANAGHEFAQDVEFGGDESESQIPGYLEDLSEEETALLKMASSLERRENLEQVGRDKMGQVASASSRVLNSSPNVPAHYFLGWLPADYADSPLEVIKRLEMEIAGHAERLFEDKGYQLDPKSITRSNFREYESVSRGVYGKGCGDYESSKEEYIHAIYGTPCNLQFRIGYGGDKNRRAEGIDSRYTFNDPSEIVERVTMPEKGLPDRIAHLSGKKVWRINPEAALEDMKFVLYMPPTAQFDIDSFYKSLSETLPGDLFFHVTFNEAFPVWTGNDLKMRGVAYMLDHGEELTFLEPGHEAFQ